MRTVRQFKTKVLILFACLVYLSVVGATTICLAQHVYDWRAGQFVFMALNFITFVMAFVALCLARRIK